MIRDRIARLVKKKEITGGIWHFTLECPVVAEKAEPGNFVAVKVADARAPFLRRPLGIFNPDREKGTFDILFREVGHGTHLLSLVRENDKISVRGPIGNTFAPFKHKRVIAVAGSLGNVPLMCLRKKTGPFEKFFLGVGNASWREFAQRTVTAVPETVLYSDDGSLGLKGFSVDGLRNMDLSDVSIVACGPTPMMKALYRQYGDKCDDIQVSLEKRMGCGMGGCFGCVIDTVNGKRRVCVDGPVFNAREVIWDELSL